MKGKLSYDKLHIKEKSKKSSYLNVKEDWPEIKNYILKNVKESSKIIELGSGGGFFVEWLYKNGYKNILATDNSNICIKIINKKYPKIKTKKMNAQKFNLKDIDVIISLDLIEHLIDVEEHLKSVYSSLKKGGIYIIKTPNKFIEDIYYKKILLRKDKFKKHPWWKAHISLMTSKDLKSKLNNHGFSSKFIKQKRLTIAQEKKVKLILGNRIGSLVSKIVNLMIKLIPKNMGVQFICIAKKK